MRHSLYPNLDIIDPKYTPQLGATAIRLLKEGKSFSAVRRAVEVHRDTIKNRKTLEETEGSAKAILSHL